MKKIAITGKMGSGKSSVTKIIKELENAYVTSFSGPIRKTIQSVGLKPTRELMQATGDFFREFDNLVWTNLLLQETSSKQGTIVVEGVRYIFEAEKLRSEGFKILRVFSNEDQRKKRIEKREGVEINDKIWDEWQNHGTEKFVDLIKADYCIDNNDSLEPLRETVKEILNNLELQM